MGYRRAEEILPKEMIELIQEYVDGETIYIPRKTGQRAGWGTKSAVRQELENRNRQIFRDYCCGVRAAELAEKYFLSAKSIRRIISRMK